MKFLAGMFVLLFGLSAAAMAADKVSPPQVDKPVRGKAAKLKVDAPRPAPLIPVKKK